MPQIQTIGNPERAPEPTGVQDFFSRLGKSYKDENDRVEIGKILGEYQANREDANAWEKAVYDLEKSTISPSRRLEAQETLRNTQKSVIEKDKILNQQVKDLQTDKEKQDEIKLKEDAAKKEKESVANEVDALLEQGGVSPEERRRLSPILSVASARAMIKPEKHAKGPKEKFEEGRASQAAKEVGDLEKEIAKGADVIANIDTVEKLSEEQLKGLTGYAKAALNTEAASQLRTLGATNLGTVIKLFNPAGTLPTAKLNWIRDTFSVSPWDNRSTVNGKLNTQRIIANQATARAKERIGLLKKYYGNIPEDVAKDFDNQTETLIDAMAEELLPNQQKPNSPGGKVRVRDKKTGKTGTVTAYPGMEQKYDVLGE